MRALDGIRVVDLTWVLAGPIATSHLAYHGAEVIKVETTARGDGLSVPLGVGTSMTWGNRCALQAGKKSIGLNVNDPRGLDLALRLIAASDVLVDNYAPRTMPRLGLHWEAVREVNPRLIMLQMPALGSAGPHRDVVGYGPNLEGLSGIQMTAGWPGGPPVGSGQTLNDAASPQHAVVAVLAALLHRDRMGRGQVIDLSQLESGVALLGPLLLAHSLTGEIPEPNGNRSDRAAPHGTFRCRGADRWVAISVQDDDDWERFVAALGSPSWALDERFRSRDGRREHVAAIEASIEAWTSEHTAEDVMWRLQGAGIAAGAVQTSGDVAERDPHLQAQGHLAFVEAPGVGEVPVARHAVDLSETPGAYDGPVPFLGQHNADVFGGLLGLSADEQALLERDGVIERVEPEPPDPDEVAALPRWWQPSIHPVAESVISPAP